MNNITTGLKKFLTNKNTVTVLGVLLAVVVLYVGYNWRVSAATNPIEVPYAIKTISAGTEITEDAVGTIDVPPAMLKGDVIRDTQNVIGKYTMADTIIPEGSLFYGRAVCEKEQLPANIILSYPKGYVLYYMGVNMETTYSNSIYPGNYIDVYLKASVRNADGTGDAKVTFGKLLENVKVLAVRDSNGKNVFSNTDDNSVPSQLIFAVPQEHYLLLKKAEYLGNLNTELLPVPTAESLKSNPGDLKISSESLRDFINANTVYAG
ncbi:MAG: hypothetical protein IKO49_08370 [Bacilli bacterium]|nr:hypothetical protein [Bacilli bacterium]